MGTPSCSLRDSPGRSLAGKTILVTGAARRIGRGIALRLALDGARVAIHYGRSEAQARRTAQDCDEAGGGAQFFQANLESVPEICSPVRRYGSAPRPPGRLGEQRSPLHPLDITERD